MENKIQTGKFVTVTKDFNPDLMVNIATICGETEDHFLYLADINSHWMHLFGEKYSVTCVEIGTGKDDEKIFDHDEGHLITFNAMPHCQQDFIDFFESNKWLKL